MNPDQVFGNGGGGATFVPGYGWVDNDTVGFSFGGALKSIGNVANLALNPIQHARMLGGALSGAAGVARGVVSPSSPPPPPAALTAGMAQAGAMTGGNTIHAYMGLGAVSWTGTDESLKTMSAEPQSSFIGNRLVIAARYTSGAAGLQVTITQPLTVSGMPQTPAPSQAAPIEMFSAEATYSRLDLQIATSATQITIGFSISDAPGSADTVNVSAGLYGEWVR